MTVVLLTLICARQPERAFCPSTMQTQLSQGLRHSANVFGLGLEELRMEIP